MTTIPGEFPTPAIASDEHGEYFSMERLQTLSAAFVRRCREGGELLEQNLTAHIAHTIFLSWLRRRNCAAVQGQDQSGASTNYNAAALLLLRALIYAARSNELASERHSDSILQIWSHLFPNFEVYGIVDKMQTEDIDPQVLKDQIMFKEEGLDIYFISSLLLCNPDFLEASYLDLLASILSITPSLKKVLDQQARDCSHAPQPGA